MNGNSFGTIFRITSWGESHGPALGAIVDGCPAGLALCEKDFLEDMGLRQGGSASFTTSRKEPDLVTIESGVYQGRTTGTPISLRILNQNTRSEDYAAYEDIPRPGHADLTTYLKQGHRDPRGGGRSSARETAARVAAGVVAKKLLAHYGVELLAYMTRIGELSLSAEHKTQKLQTLRELRNKNPLLLPLELEESSPFLDLVEKTKAEQDSLGGAIFCTVHGLAPGLGEPVFDKLNALLAHALMSLPAAVACEIGGGQALSFLPGSAIRDPIESTVQGSVKVAGSKHGGLLGGMTTGAPLFASVAFHAPTSIPQPIESVSLQSLEARTLSVQGRHDSTPLPRAVPMVEAMVAITLADAMLRAGRIPEKLLLCEEECC